MEQLSDVAAEATQTSGQSSETEMFFGAFIKRPRIFLYVPGETSIPAGVKLEGLLGEKKTAVRLQSGLEHEAVDTWPSRN